MKRGLLVWLVWIALAFFAALAWNSWRTGRAGESAARGLDGSSSGSVAEPDERATLVGDGNSAASLSARGEAGAPTVLSGRVVDEAGQGLADVEVSWTTLPSDDELGPARMWSAVDWEAVERLTLVATSDAAGRFRFEAAPAQADQRVSALWATAPDREAALQLTPPIAGQPLGIELGAWSLATAPGPRFEVVDTRAQPVAEARIDVFGLQPFEAPLANVDAALARRILRRTLHTDAEGRARGFAFPSSCAVRASKDRLHSGAWTPSRLYGDAKRLVVGPLFRANGVVHVAQGQPDGSPLFVRCDASDGRLFEQLGQTRVRADGGFGPFELPILDAWTSYRFAVEGGGLAPVAVEHAPPPPEGELFVELSTSAGIELRVEARDELDRPVGGARVVVDSYLGEQRLVTSRRTEADGVARFDGCVPGPIVVRASAPGFAPFQGDLLLDPLRVEPLRIELERAGRIEGRVTHGGKPVESFDIAYWQGPVGSFKTESFSDRADGSFVLDTAPLGDVWLFAASFPHAQTRPQSVRVASDEGAAVEFELPLASRARGRVIDLSTLQPVAGAAVQLYARAGNQLMAKVGPQVRSAADGGFALEGALPGLSSFMVLADGYGMTIPTVEGPLDGEVIVLADTPLMRKQALTVQLAAQTPTDFTGYLLDVVAHDWAPPTQVFAADGVVRIAALTPGRTRLNLVAPDETYYLATRFLTPGADWTHVFTVGEATSLALEARFEDGEPLPEDCSALLHYFDPRGGRVEANAPPVGVGRWRFGSIAANHGELTLVGREGLLHAQPVALTNGANDLEVRVARERARFRLVDASGVGVPGATVRLSSASHAAWDPWFDTDPQGYASAPLFEYDDVLAAVYSLEHGSASELPVRRPRGASDVVEIELDADCELELTVVDGAVALPAVQFLLHNRALTIDYAEFTTDAHGVARIPRLARGVYRAVIDQPGLWRQIVDLDVNARSTLRKVDVRRTGDLDLQAREHGTAASGMRVVLESVEFGVEVDEWLAQGLVASSSADLSTDEEGRLRITGLPRGSYRWRCGSSEGVLETLPRAVTRVEIAVQR